MGGDERLEPVRADRPDVVGDNRDQRQHVPVGVTRGQVDHGGCCGYGQIDEARGEPGVVADILETLRVVLQPADRPVSCAVQGCRASRA